MKERRWCIADSAPSGRAGTPRNDLVYSLGDVVYRTRHAAGALACARRRNDVIRRGNGTEMAPHGA